MTYAQRQDAFARQDRANQPPRDAPAKPSGHQALSGYQLGKYSMTHSLEPKDDHWNYDSGESEPHERGPNEEATHHWQMSHEDHGVVGDLSVHAKPRVDDTYIVPHASTTAQPDSTWHRDNAYGEHAADYARADEPSQGRLMVQRQKSSPAHDEVYSLFAAKDHRNMVSTLVGTAQNETAKRTGRPLGTPEDLSQHSSRMVTKLQGAGAVSQDAPNRRVNALSFSGDGSSIYGSNVEDDDNLRDVPAHEMRAGSNTMRSALRSGRTPKSQGTQPVLSSGDHHPFEPPHQLSFQFH